MQAHPFITSHKIYNLTALILDFEEVYITHFMFYLDWSNLTTVGHLVEAGQAAAQVSSVYNNCSQATPIGTNLFLKLELFPMPQLSI